jgi:metal-sulfur cluster biosynthetic enzyme
LIDPEFPLVDVRTMGLIYEIIIDHESFQIIIRMTLTTPACPAADYLPQQVKDIVQEYYENYEVELLLVRDPTWTIAMIKDEDLKRMFEF